MDGLEKKKQQMSSLNDSKITAKKHKGSGSGFTFGSKGHIVEHTHTHLLLSHRVARTRRIAICHNTALELKMIL